MLLSTWQVRIFLYQILPFCCGINNFTTLHCLWNNMKQSYQSVLYWGWNRIKSERNRHMGLKHASREKKLPMVNFLIFVHKNVYRIWFQEMKIGGWEGFEKKAVFSLFLMRKRLSSGQKWFLRPYFPLMRRMFVFRSVKFSFRALEVPEPRVRKPHFSKWKTPLIPDFQLLDSYSTHHVPISKKNPPLKI